MEHRLRVWYRLRLAAGDDARGRAAAIAREQTVELPPGCVTPDVERDVVGVIETLEALGPGVARAAISYDARRVGTDLPQLLGVLFGNVSMQPGVRIERVDWPAAVLARFRGPRHGIDGLRRLCGVTARRPLLCVALKPLGASAGRLAELAGDFARAGVDLVKDDHGLGDQPSAPFAERVAACARAVERANAASGRSTLYVPHLSGPAESLAARADAVEAAGCRGLLVCPLVLGCDHVRALADERALAVLAHPALAGAFFHPDHGIAPEVLLGQVFRIAGADGVVYPNAGGRFPLGERECAAINRALRGPLGTLLPSAPVPGGGIDAARLPAWAERYGPDTVFLIGGSLYSRPDPAAAAAELVSRLRA